MNVLSSPKLYLKDVYFSSKDPEWTKNYLATRSSRITSMLDTFLGNEFWENYARVRLRFEKEGKLLLRIKSVTENAVCFTQIWTSEEVAEQFRAEALRGVDMMALLKKKGIDHQEVIKEVSEDEAQEVIKQVLLRPHIIQVIDKRWRTENMPVGDPLKRGKMYLPFPEGGPIQILKEVPKDLFLKVQEEIRNIDWNNLPMPDRRSRTGVFKTSTAIHLRVHKVMPDTPDTLEAHGNIIECIDTKVRHLYPAVNSLVDWMYDEVVGTHLGRIMIVKLSAGGGVGTHIDAGKYFEFHSRFHVPIVTNSGVIFTGENESRPSHMPEGHLTRLINQKPHGVKNNSDQDRVHLIVDIASSKMANN